MSPRVERLWITTPLSLRRNCALVSDEIHNLMLLHLPDVALQFLLRVHNCIWEEHTIPALWPEAIVIPALKDRKDRSLSSSYRPVALTSCVCKVLERMVNHRLVWTLECRNLLTPIQETPVNPGPSRRFGNENFNLVCPDTTPCGRTI